MPVKRNHHLACFFGPGGHLLGLACRTATDAERRERESRAPALLDGWKRRRAPANGVNRTAGREPSRA